MGTRSFVGVACATTIVVLATTSRADTEAFTIGPRPVWYFMGGVTSGATVLGDDHGAFVGGELSFVRLRNGWFAGVYGDGYYDGALRGAATTSGIELGHKLVGIDGGGALRFAHGDVAPGVTARLYVTLGVLAVFTRYAFADDERNAHVLQIGGLLKLPLLSPMGLR